LSGWRSPGRLVIHHPSFNINQKGENVNVDSEEFETLEIDTRVSMSTRLKQFPWWALILVIAGITFGILIFTNDFYHATLITLLRGRAASTATEGILLTARITLIGFGIAIVLGLLTGLARVSSNTVLYTIASLYVEVVRGIPLVVLMLYIAFVLIPFGIAPLITGIGRFLNIASMATFTTRQISYEARAITALAFGYGAYQAEIFRAGIQSIERGQMEASRSLGMSYFQAMRHVILPQAIRRVLPPLGNDFISMLKDSALATVLAVPELTQMGRILRGASFRIYEVYNVITFLYLTMTLVLSAGVKALERRMRLGKD
jgi:polar amino acid transport system permease protein